jgi:hypothetical protein
MSKPLSMEAITSMLMVVTSANASLYSLALEMNDDEADALRAMTFEPCGTHDCLCHQRKESIKQLILSCYADAAEARPLHSHPAPPSEGLSAQAAAQNPRLN